MEQVVMKIRRQATITVMAAEAVLQAAVRHRQIIHRGVTQQMQALTAGCLYLKP